MATKLKRDKIMSTKLIYFLMILLLSTIYFSCHKKSDSITGFTEDDTTNNGGPVIKKPNIYIYPTEKFSLDVQLKFPNGGKIIASAPEYLNSWHIQVEPTGLINDQYQFLFYEARIPEILQRKSGWIIKGKDLENFFQENLINLLFSKKEISDFLEYWIPRLRINKTYVIYPHYAKDLSEIVDIRFSVPPDNIIRVLYLIEEYQGNQIVKLPQVPSHQREGFTVLEWGVVYQ